jgi:hypothetical protein
MSIHRFASFRDFVEFRENVHFLFVFVQFFFVFYILFRLPIFPSFGPADIFNLINKYVIQIIFEYMVVELVVAIKICFDGEF